jgi:hypothetical protein
MTVDPLDMPLPDRRPYEDAPRKPERRFVRIHALLRFTGDHLIPVLVTAGLNVAPRLGYFTLLPLTSGLERVYGNLALLFGAAAALVASVTYGREEIRFDIPAFLGTMAAGLVTVTPFILAREGLTFGLPSREFDILLTFAYVGFFAVVGLLVGGCWSVAVRAVRDARGSIPLSGSGARAGRGY